MLRPVFVDDHILENWLEARPYILKAIERAPFPYSEDALYLSILNGHHKLFFLIEDDKVKGVAVFNIVQDLNVRFLNAYIVSHDDGYTREDEDFAQGAEMAKAMGIEWMCYFGRRGFLRKHGPKGWKVAQTVMVREV